MGGRTQPGLRPICLSTQKLYGTWGDSSAVQEELLSMARGREDCHLSVQRAAGHPIVRLKSRNMEAPPFPFSRHHTGEADGDGTSAGRESASRRPVPWRRRTERIAADLLPPVLTRAIRGARASRRAAARLPGGSR